MTYFCVGQKQKLSASMTKTYWHVRWPSLATSSK